MPTVAAVVPSIPTRRGWRANALKSIWAQLRPVDEVIVEIDDARTGAAATRNRGWQQATADFIAFLDDDDVWYPEHIDLLLDAAEDTQADLVYPWFDVSISQRPGWKGVTEGGQFMQIDGASAEGHPFDNDAERTLMEICNFIPVTVLVRRDLLAEVGGFPLPGTETWPHAANEDWGCWQAIVRAGARIHHLNERTWQWRWHQHHTMGQGDRW